MQQLPDYHVHTCFSGDSDTPVKKMLEQAVSLGLSEICITDHMDYDYPDDPDLFLFDVREYFSVLNSFKEAYGTRLSVKIGVELGLQPHLADIHRKFVIEYPFDFIIGSSHVVDKADPYYPSFWEGKKPETVIRHYFASILENINTFSDFDVYGHLDYIVRYCPDKSFVYRYEDYMDILDECLRTLIEKGKGIEVNTAGFKYGLGHPNPHETILKRYRELGGEILTLGSDGHKPEHLAWDFEKLPELLKSCGFQYVTTFEKRKPVFHTL
ncbi:MAG: histidinol-phosphatase HisJ family protein [Lachnospiraceae bacterium]|nr:histidinol-phosphatase HisJ family protein [Lachnospiraceae bacterium]